MFDSIVSATIKKAKEIAAELIPTGTVIQYLREHLAEFDYPNGGLSLCRDGYHLSLDYGRYAAAATWLRTFQGTPLRALPFFEFDFEKTSKIINSVNTVCHSAKDLPHFSTKP